MSFYRGGLDRYPVPLSSIGAYNFSKYELPAPAYRKAVVEEEDDRSSSAEESEQSTATKTTNRSNDDEDSNSAMDIDDEDDPDDLELYIAHIVNNIKRLKFVIQRLERLVHVMNAEASSAEVDSLVRIMKEEDSTKDEDEDDMSE
jgi:hypothetical protein